MTSHEELVRTMELGDLALRLHQAGIPLDAPRGKEGIEFAKKYFEIKEQYNPIQDNQNQKK